MPARRDHMRCRAVCCLAKARDSHGYRCTLHLVPIGRARLPLDMFRAYLEIPPEV